MKKAGSFLAALLCSAGAVLLLQKGDLAAIGASQGITLCLETVIPSLFCFMVLTNFLILSGLYSCLSRPLGLVTKYLFNLPPQVGSVVILSWVGGYPAGALSISRLLHQNHITSSEAQRMLYYCFCAGPSFVITAVGSRMFGSSYLGILLFCAQSLTSLLFAIVTGIFSRRKKAVNLLEHPFALVPEKSCPLGESFVQAVGQAVSACGKMCGFIILFQAVSSLVSPWLPDEKSACFLLGPLEVTSGCRLAAKLPFGILYASFLLSLGGLCVLAQIASILHGLPISIGKLFFSRILHGLCSAAILFFMIHASTKAMEVFSSSCRPVPVCNDSTPFLSICLIMMSTLLFSHIEKLNREN